MSSALVSSRSPVFGSGRLRGPIDITTRRSAPDLLVIGIALRVSERLPLVATSTLGGRSFRSETADAGRLAGIATATPTTKTGTALFARGRRTPQA